MSRHRSDDVPDYRARYGRLAVLVVSLLTTAVALLGGLGVLPSAADDDETASDTAVDAAGSGPGGSGQDALVAADRRTPRSGAASAAPSADPSVAPSSPDPRDDTTLPAGTGSGRRVVFSEERQRVWLVQSSGRVQRTYLVSGSVSDNLDPGRYEVFSRSRDAVGVDDSGTMKWFVRFTRGPSGAAIGFHTIPVDAGRRVQTSAQLGTPRSHGCIRQDTDDAVALWGFAPLGTTVVVV